MMDFPKKRKLTRQIQVGNVPIGGGAPIVIQSMTKTVTSDIKATIEQIHELEESGCEIVRVSVRDEVDAQSIPGIIKESSIPVIADIHFDHRLAIKSIQGGIKGVRINPGNIRGRERIKEIVSACKDNGVAMRIGVNAGSLERDLREMYIRKPAHALVESALRSAELIESCGMDNYKISLKATDVKETVTAYRLFSKRSNNPLHLGLTESGTPFRGGMRSALALGVLLGEGIGDTVRVSLAGDPVKEVVAAYCILNSLGLRERGVRIIACPTCGRKEIDVVHVAEALEERLTGISLPVDIAVMGCIVNGPGEASRSSIGIVGAKDGALLYREGQRIGRIKKGGIISRVIKEVESGEWRVERREWGSNGKGAIKVDY